MTTAVLLAAGMGTRLRPYTRQLPKPLTKILGKPIIEYSLNALKNAGIEDIVVVTGYLGSQIRKHLKDGEHLGVKIRYCHNSRYMLGNAISLKAAKKALSNKTPFFLLMGDHLFSEAIIEKAAKNIDQEPLLCIDKSPHYPPQIKDATKVLIDRKGYIIDIGKNISRWNAVDTGLFILDNTIFEVIYHLEKRKPDLTITDCIKYLSLNVKPVWGCDITEHFWFDIDTQQDIEFVESFLREVLKCQENGME